LIEAINTIDFYYENLNPTEIDGLIKNAGRVSHIMRNIIQGYVNANFPEILNLDNTAGQIEGQCRLIRSNLRQSKDVKQPLIASLKLAKFIKNTLAEGFFKSKSFPIEKLDSLRTWADSLNKYFQKADELINKAIFEISAEVSDKNVGGYGSTPDFSSFSPNLLDGADEEIEKAFDYEKYFDEKLVDTDKNLVQYKQILVTLGSYVSNTSHWVQDEVSDLTETPRYAELANKIINTAGNIENQGRAIVAETARNEPNQGNLKNACENSIKGAFALTALLQDRDFPKDRTDLVNKKAKLIGERIIVSIKKVIKKGYKD
jgi:hypothetical protein